MCLKIGVCMANGVGPDQMPRSAVQNTVPDLGLHCLQWPICLITKGYLGNEQKKKNEHSIQ